MKKALIVLLMLAVAGGLFAAEITDELTIDGEVLAGVWVRFGDSVLDEEGDKVVNIYGDTDDDDGDIVHASVTFTYDADDWGLKIGSGMSIGGSWAFSNAYGWMYFFDHLLNVKAGLIDDGVWSTGGYVDTGFATGGGLRLEVTPFDGLNVGAFFSFVDAAAGPDKIASFLQETAFGFSFDGGLFDVSAALKLHSEDCTVEGYEADEMDMAFTFGVGLNMIDIVGIYLGFLFDNVIGDPDIGVTLGQNFTFNLGGALGASLELGEYICDGLKKIDITPEVTFDLGDGLGVGASLPIAMEDYDDSLSFASIGLNAWITKAIGNASMKAGYGFTKTMEDFGDSLDHYIKLVFGYSF